MKISFLRPEVPIRGLIISGLLNTNPGQLLGLQWGVGRLQLILFLICLFSHYALWRLAISINLISPWYIRGFKKYNIYII